jgi:hypothetical protein
MDTEGKKIIPNNRDKWIISVLVIIIILLVANNYNRSDKISEYGYCVDDCVYSANDCIGWNDNYI